MWPYKQTVRGKNTVVRSVCQPIFNLVPEAISLEYRSGLPGRPLYADSLVQMADCAEEFMGKYIKHGWKVWKCGEKQKQWSMGWLKLLKVATGLVLSVNWAQVALIMV